MVARRALRAVAMIVVVAVVVAVLMAVVVRVLLLDLGKKGAPRGVEARQVGGCGGGRCRRE